MKSQLRLYCLVLVACGGSGPSARTTTVDSSDKSLASLRADHVKGSIGFAAFSNADAAGMMPVAEVNTVVAVDLQASERDLAGEVLLLGGSGQSLGRNLGKRTIQHGCEQQTLDVVAFSQDQAIGEGVTWILPKVLPAGWQPSVLPLVQLPSGTAQRQEWRAGDVRVVSELATATTGKITLFRNGKAIGDAAYERGRMDDDPSATIDLSDATGNPGVPTPVAAWQVAPAGPIVLAFYTEGFEGSGVESFLLQTDRSEPIPQLSVGAYYCAY